MAYSINYNTSGQSGTKDMEISFYSIDPTDFAEVTNVAGTYKVTNISSPIPYPEVLEKDFTKLKNVYSGTGIDPSIMLPRKEGTKVAYRIKQTWTYEDSSDPSAPIYALPVSASLTITLPNAPFIAKADIVQAIERALGLLYAGGAEHIANDVRGSLVFVTE